MTDAEKLGVRLREARKNIGFSMEDVQQITGYSRQQIGRYECGKNIPRLQVLAKLCKIYAIDMKLILAGLFEE